MPLPNRTDLSNDVTVFVLTVGESTLLACLGALQQQTCKFRLERIENVAPMDRALQQQLDRCKTQYYVQVDADMILESDAIERLYLLIRQQTPEVMQALISLRDEHLGRDIIGVRIVRHALAKQFPYRPVQGCETDQMRRAREVGFETIAKIGPHIKPAGIHAHITSPHAAFERYRTLFKRARKDEGIDWVYPYAKEFTRRLFDEPNEINLFVFLGMVAGTLAPLEVEDGEKNAAAVSDELCRLYDLFRGALPCKSQSAS